MITIGGGNDYQSAALRLRENPRGYIGLSSRDFQRVATSLRSFLVSGLEQCRTTVKLFAGELVVTLLELRRIQRSCSKTKSFPPWSRAPKRIPLASGEVSHLLDTEESVSSSREMNPHALCQRSASFSSQLKLVFMFQIIFGKTAA